MVNCYDVDYCDDDHNNDDHSHYCKKIMASKIIITIMEAMRIDHDNGVWRWYNSDAYDEDTMCIIS